MKIAVLISFSQYNRTGLFYASTNKVKALQKNNLDLEITVYNLVHKLPLLINIFRYVCNPKIEIQRKYQVLNGVKCQNIWLSEPNLFQYIKQYFKHKDAHSNKNQLELLKSYLFDKQLIIAHFGNEAGRVALSLSKELNIPFAVTYHGTDIHTTPFRSPENYNVTAEMLDKSSANIFVSGNLSELSNTIGVNSNRFNYVINNGIDHDVFKRNLPVEETRRKNEIRTIGFVGNLVGVKNVLLLPYIFQEIQNLSNNQFEFLVIGNGPQKKPLKKLSDRLKLNVTYLGKIPSVQLPNYYYKMDVLVLPSKNEGQGLVLVEALACGVSCIGSLVGGIPEVIGIENCVELDQNFVSNFAKKVIEVLQSDDKHEFDTTKFSMQNNAIQEADIYRNIIKENL